ncbi:MAG: NTP transferase domain-containing protein [Woeseiaceae bacterium]|nr:NTP transferase domain-containing protein [Woeseiaceae bacterium]
MSNPVYGLVLAGGQSRRMGQDKALLRRGDISQLAYVMDMLEDLLPKVFVSVRADQAGEPERAKFPQIVDRFEDMGPVAGVLSALEEHPEADWLVVACDLPNLDAGTIKYLLENVDASRAFTAYESSHDGLPEPLCAVYRRGSANTLKSFVDEGLKCPRKMLIRSDTRLLRQPDPHSLDNVNTPTDLADSVLETGP